MSIESDDPPTPEMMVEHLDGQVQTLLRENERLRATWLYQIQEENDCYAFKSRSNLGKPCHSHKCGCALEMQSIIDAGIPTVCGH